MNRGEMIRALNAGADAITVSWDRQSEIEKLLGYEVDGLQAFLENYAGDPAHFDENDLDNFLAWAKEQGE